MPETDLPLLIEAAARAGAIARGFFGQDPQQWDKGDGAGPVTEADLAVNDMLHEMLRTARPDYGWLSEETEDDPDRLHARRLFVVDPIDGTRAFIEGGKDWGHSIAVVEDGRPVAGVIAIPMRDQIFSAETGAGAYLNASPIQTSAVTEPRDATILAAKPNLRAAHWRDGAPPPFKTTFRSSLAYRLGLAASARYDAMLTLRPTWEWDIAAGAIIVEEAGGRATDRTGRVLRFNNALPQVDSVVAGGAIHALLIAALEPGAPAVVTPPAPQ